MRIANYEEVSGEAFSRKLRKNAAFFEKGGTKELLFISQLFSNSR
ncbi:hypothetical protein [Komagataeibacter swingsii]|nr:hypothetical protein [Komagataeibacter swingsii]